MIVAQGRVGRAADRSGAILVDCVPKLLSRTKEFSRCENSILLALPEAFDLGRSRHEDASVALSHNIRANVYISHLIIFTTSRNITVPYPLRQGTLIAIRLALTTERLVHRPAIECGPGLIPLK